MRVYKRGFTLIEIMVVVVLISLLAGFVSARVISKLNSSKLKIAETVIKGTLTQALQQFYIDNSFYPTTEQGLDALVEMPSGSPEPPDYDEDGYMDEVPPDPWGTPYQYECPGSHNRRRFDLCSAGPDR